ncbi:MAG: nitronate monooxygenase [Planctomycetota bacterium]|nr:nitronate monooxygenase [Planctomycetota bacterium]
MSQGKTKFTEDVGIEVPLICGAMYPCSNPELVAAVSEAGGIGIIQPISLTYVHGHEYRAGLKFIKSLTSKPVGFNALIEASSQIYMERMKKWVNIALEEDVKFFVTALGNPRWVVDLVHQVGGKVYHDVTDRKWAMKALDGGVDGLICVNNRAGGHLGSKTPQQLFDEMGDLGKPLICAGGIGSPKEFQDALKIGYAGVQLGTRFIASKECKTHETYKDAIVKAKEEDIVSTVKISGVPVSVIRTEHVKRVGTEAGPIARWLLRGRKTKHWMRLFYSLKSLRSLKHSSLKGENYKDYFQAGKSVETIDEVLSAGDIVKEFADSLAPTS